MVCLPGTAASIRSGGPPFVLCIVLMAACGSDSSGPPIPPPDEISWAILGDSNTDEYRADDDRAGGTSYEATTLNWLELLVNEKELNAGGWSESSRGEPRRAGYERNWARSGARLANIEGLQLPGVLAQIAGGQATHVVLQLPVNDWDDSADMFDQLYNSPDAGVHTQDGRLVATLVGDYLLRVREVLIDLAAAGAQGIVVFTLPDYMAYPTAALRGYTDSTRRRYHSAMIEDLNAGVASLVTELNSGAGSTIGTVADWDEYMRPALSTVSGQNIVVAGATINVGVSPDGSPGYLFVANHASTIVSGTVANAFMNAANDLPGVNLTRFTDSEIRRNSGI